MTVIDLRLIRITAAASFVGFALMLSACGPAADRTAADSSPATVTSAAASSSTPAPSPTTTANLLGSVALSVQLTDGARPTAPEGFVLYVGRDGDQEVAVSRSPSGSFALTVAPGRYQARHVTITASSLSAQPIDIPIQVGSFVVPPTGCAYLGDVLVAVARLAPGSQQDQAAQAAAFAKATGASSEFIYLPSGGFIKDGYLDNANPTPPPNDPAAGGCTATKMQ